MLPGWTQIASSDKQWTGVAVSQSGRIFVNYPTWNDYPRDYQVAELVDGKLQAYPSPEANRDFVCVQSVIADGENHLWILDPAKLRDKPVAKTGARLYEVDLSTNRITRIFVFPETVARPGSYLNDVRLDLNRKVAYLTDSGEGGIVVLDLSTGDAWRALTDIPQVKANLQQIELCFHRPRYPCEPKAMVWNSPLTAIPCISPPWAGQTLRRTHRRAEKPKLTVPQRQRSIQVENPQNVPTDGLILDGHTLYMADLPKETLWTYDLKKHQGKDPDLGQPLRWADSFAKGPDGTLYFTTSQINYPKNQRTKYGLYNWNLKKNKRHSPPEVNGGAFCSVQQTLRTIAGRLQAAEGALPSLHRRVLSF